MMSNSLVLKSTMSLVTKKRRTQFQYKLLKHLCGPGLRTNTKKTTYLRVKLLFGNG